MVGEPMKCSNCGAVLAPEAGFCDLCGKRVERPAAPSPCESSPQCDGPFRLLAALPPAMQVGRRSLVHLRFRAGADIYESVDFVLRNGCDELARCPCCNGRPFTLEHDVTLAVTPRVCGAARIALDVVCRVGPDCDEEIHTASLDVAVDERMSDSFSPVINISQTQTSDRAGDTKGGDINVNLAPSALSADAATRYATPATFAPCRTSLRKSPPRLTLKGESDVVQLLSDGVVTFGRNRDNDVPLRIFGPDGTLDAAANEHNLSRFHFRIARDSRDCLVIDGGSAPGRDDVMPSAYGTRVDGEKLLPAGSLRIVSGRDVRLGVGREEVELKMRLRFLRDNLGRPSGVVLDREDGARQRVCAVWREVPLSDSETVRWNGSHWAIVAGSGEPLQLAVGAVVSVGGKPYEVMPFHQTHLN